MQAGGDMGQHILKGQRSFGVFIVVAFLLPTTALAQSSAAGSSAPGQGLLAVMILVLIAFSFMLASLLILGLALWYRMRKEPDEGDTADNLLQGDLPVKFKEPLVARWHALGRAAFFKMLIRIGLEVATAMTVFLGIIGGLIYLTGQAKAPPSHGALVLAACFAVMFILGIGMALTPRDGRFHLHGLLLSHGRHNIKVNAGSLVSVAIDELPACNYCRLAIHTDQTPEPYLVGLKKDDVRPIVEFLQANPHLVAQDATDSLDDLPSNLTEDERKCLKDAEEWESIRRKGARRFHLMCVAWFGSASAIGLSVVMVFMNPGNGPFWLALICSVPGGSALGAALAIPFSVTIWNHSEREYARAQRLKQQFKPNGNDAT